MNLTKVKQRVSKWDCKDGKAFPVNPFDGHTENPFWYQYEKWAFNNQPLTELTGVFYADRVEVVEKYEGLYATIWSEIDKGTYEHVKLHGLDGYQLIDTRLTHHLILKDKGEKPAQITIGDTSFTKLADGFIQILTKNGCVELVPEEIKELYKFIK